VLAVILRGFRLVPAEARASMLEDAVHARSLSVCIYSVNTVHRMRGRPPLRPFFRAASVLAAEVRRPPWRPSSASHAVPVNTEETSPGTLRSRSRLSQCRPLPRPRTSTARRSLGLSPLRLGISLTGRVMVAPFVSSMRKCVLLSAVCHAGGPRLSNRCKAPGARRPGEVRTQLLLYPVRHQTSL
jgi:hypothetical protein